MSEQKPDDAVKLVGTLHMLAIDAAAKILLEAAMKGAESGLFSAYFAANGSTLKDNDPGKPTVQLSGCIVVIAGNVPKADIEALEHYIGGMTQETMLTGKDVRTIVDLTSGPRPGAAPGTPEATDDEDEDGDQPS